MLMSFVGAIGSLMTETGLSEVLKSVFGGVEKMLTGKKFLMNMRAMRMVAEELLRDIINKSELNSYSRGMVAVTRCHQRRGLLADSAQLPKANCSTSYLPG